MRFVALEGKASDLVGVAGAAVHQIDGGLIGEVGEGAIEGQERAEFVTENGVDNVGHDDGGIVGDHQGDEIGMEIEEGPVVAIGDAGDEAVLGGGPAHEGSGGGGRATVRPAAGSDRTGPDEDEAVWREQEIVARSSAPARRRAGMESQTDSGLDDFKLISQL